MIDSNIRAKAIKWYNEERSQYGLNVTLEQWRKFAQNNELDTEEREVKKLRSSVYNFLKNKKIKTTIPQQVCKKRTKPSKSCNKPSIPHHTPPQPLPLQPQPSTSHTTQSNPATPQNAGQLVHLQPSTSPATQMNPVQLQHIQSPTTLHNTIHEQPFDFLSDFNISPSQLDDENMGINDAVQDILNKNIWCYNP